LLRWLSVDQYWLKRKEQGQVRSPTIPSSQQTFPKRRSSSGVPERLRRTAQLPWSIAIVRLIAPSVRPYTSARLWRAVPSFPVFSIKRDMSSFCGWQLNNCNFGHTSRGRDNQRPSTTFPWHRPIHMPATDGRGQGQACEVSPGEHIL